MLAKNGKEDFVQDYCYKGQDYCNEIKFLKSIPNTAKTAGALQPWSSARGQWTENY